MDVVHQLDLECQEGAIKLFPCRAAMGGNCHIVGEFADTTQVLTVIVVFLDHDLHGHMCGGASSRDDEGKEDLFFFCEVVFDVLADSAEQVGKASGEIWFACVDPFDFFGQFDESWQFEAQGRVVSVKDMLNQFVEGTLVPARGIGGVGAFGFDIAKDGFGVDAFCFAGFGQGLFSTAAVVQAVSLEDFGCDRVGCDEVTEFLFYVFHGHCPRVLGMLVRR